jgi:hypothetical protein
MRPTPNTLKSFHSKELSTEVEKKKCEKKIKGEYFMTHGCSNSSQINL